MKAFFTLLMTLAGSIFSLAQLGPPGGLGGGHWEFNYVPIGTASVTTTDLATQESGTYSVDLGDDREAFPVWLTRNTKSVFKTTGSWKIELTWVDAQGGRGNNALNPPAKARFQIQSNVSFIAPLNEASFDTNYVSQYNLTNGFGDTPRYTFGMQASGDCIGAEILEVDTHTGYMEVMVNISGTFTITVPPNGVEGNAAIMNGVFAKPDDRLVWIEPAWGNTYYAKETGNQVWWAPTNSYVPEYVKTLNVAGQNGAVDIGLTVKDVQPPVLPNSKEFQYSYLARVIRNQYPTPHEPHSFGWLNAINEIWTIGRSEEIAPTFGILPDFMWNPAYDVPNLWTYYLHPQWYGAPNGNALHQGQGATRTDTIKLTYTHEDGVRQTASLKVTLHDEDVPIMLVQTIRWELADPEGTSEFYNTGQGWNLPATVVNGTIDSLSSWERMTLDIINWTIKEAAAAAIPGRAAKVMSALGIQVPVIGPQPQTMPVPLPTQDDWDTAFRAGRVTQFMGSRAVNDFKWKCFRVTHSHKEVHYGHHYGRQGFEGPVKIEKFVAANRTNIYWFEEWYKIP